MFKKHKALFIALIGVLTLILAVSTFLLIWFYGDSYKDFEEFNQEFSVEKILDDEAIPQGLTNYGSGSNEFYYVSTYVNDGSPSRIYVINAKGETVGYVTVKLPEENGGGYYVGHAGGIAASSKYIWLSSRIEDENKQATERGEVLVLNLNDVKNVAKENGEVTAKRRFTVDCGADFMYYNANKLYIGEFYLDGEYETLASHHVITPVNTKQSAVIMCYNAPSSTDNTSGLESLTPEFAISIPEKIQGMAIYSSGGDNYIVLSQSWSVFKSHLLVYSNTYKSNEIEGGLNIKVGNTEKNVILYSLNGDNGDLKGNQVNDYQVPAMSEGLCISNDVNEKKSVFVLFENACVKYELVNREKLYHVYSFIPEAKQTDEE